MASSIHIGKVSSGSFLHNDRTQKVSYLIDDSSLNECSRSSSECLKEYQSLKLQASENYTKLTNQKMQKSTIFLKEAIVNLQEHHTLKDLEPIKERLESYGFKVLQISIHRDEGFINPENKKEKNYHAHITMFNLDVESGKSVKFGKDYRTELSKLQTFTANALKMERGKVSVQEHADELKVSVSKASKRLDTHDYKKAMKIKEEAQQQLTISQKEATKELTIKYDTMLSHAVQLVNKNHALETELYNFREMQKQITSLDTENVELKKELHKLNSEINKLKNDDVLKAQKIEELESKINELRLTNNRLDDTVEEYVKINTETALKLKNQEITINDLDEQKNDFKARYEQTNKQLINLRDDLKSPKVSKVNDLFDWIRDQFEQFITKIKELEERSSRLEKENYHQQKYIEVLETPLTKEEQAVKLIKDYKLEDKYQDGIVKLIEDSQSHKNPNYYIHNTMCQVVQKIEQAQKATKSQSSDYGYSR
jgi:chromosome segregation ATPase